MKNKLLAGVVEIDITPSIGIGLAGYVARDKPSIGVHDPLMAQILLLKSGNYQVMLICMDLIGVSLEFTYHVRLEIEQAIGIPYDCIMIACSHTHSGPVGTISPFINIHQKQDPQLQNTIKEKLTNAAILALERIRPAHLGVGRGTVEDICCNRNDPDSGPVDNEVIVLRIDDEDNQPLAVMMNYGCHPTVLGYKNLLISADFPGAARATLHKIYPDTVFVYTNGASGDVSTRFTRRDQTFYETERLGNILAGEVLKIMQNIITQKLVNIKSMSLSVNLRFRSFPAPEVAQRELEKFQIELDKLKKIGASSGEIRRAITKVEGSKAQKLLFKKLADSNYITSQVQFLKLGDLALLSLPGEPFTNIVLRIKEQSEYPYTAIVSYGNDYLGYFPDANSFKKQTYESLISPFNDDVGEKLYKVVLKLL